VSHYVGDACQPLHISSEFNGDPTHMVPNPKAGQKKQPPTIPLGTGVHSAYEDDMVNFHIGEITTFVEADTTALPPLFKSGPSAAKAVVRLILDTFDHIDPKKIVAAYVQQQKAGATAKDAADALWKQFGTLTSEVIADGARTLASVWQSAWAEAGAEAKAPAAGHAFTEQELTNVYAPATFVPSKTLDHICEEIKC
jgi:hypothetical protein